jgi:hypothetical protein
MVFIERKRKDNAEDCVMKSFTDCHKDDQVNEDGIDRTRSEHGL